YISTVDSGNLVACLIALRQGCFDMQHTVVVNWQGLRDTLDMLRLTLSQGGFGPAAEDLQAAIDTLRSPVQRLADPGQFTPALLRQLFDEGQAGLEGMLWEAPPQAAISTFPAPLRKLTIWIDRVRHQVRRIRIGLQVLAPWVLTMGGLPDPVGLASSPGRASAWQKLQASLPLHPQLSEIPAICERAGSLIE